MNNFNDDDEEDFEDTKAIRQKRLKNKRRDKRRDFQEQPLRAPKARRPRVRIDWDPEYDEDDYEDYYA